MGDETLDQSWLKKLRNRPVVAAAIITAIVLGGIASTTKAVRELLEIFSPRSTETSRVSPVPGASPISTNAAPQVSKELYETIATVFEGKGAFVDPETGLVFAVEDVHDWKLPSLAGATCRYTLPNSKWLGHGDRKIGHREEFRYEDRDFILVIESIDYRRNSVTIRIKEI